MVHCSVQPVTRCRPGARRSFDKRLSSRIVKSANRNSLNFLLIDLDQHRWLAHEPAGLGDLVKNTKHTACGSFPTATIDCQRSRHAKVVKQPLRLALATGISSFSNGSVGEFASLNPELCNRPRLCGLWSVRNDFDNEQGASHKNLQIQHI